MTTLEDEYNAAQEALEGVEKKAAGEEAYSGQRQEIENDLAAEYQTRDQLVSACTPDDEAPLGEL